MAFENDRGQNRRNAFYVKHGMFGGECTNPTPEQVEEKRRRDKVFARGPEDEKGENEVEVELSE